MRKDLKEILPYFLGLFLLFAAIGFFSGWDQRQNTVIDKIYPHLMADVDEQGYFLVHECNQQWTHRFYVEEDQIYKSAETQAKYLTQKAYGPPSLQNIKHRSLIMGLLGGASAGFSYKDFYNATRSKTKATKFAALKKTIAGVIGAVTGYAVGHYLGSEYDTDCDSPFALELLSKTDLWQTLEHQWIYFSITETEYGEEPILWRASGQNINPTQDDPIVLCETSLNKALGCLKLEAETSPQNVQLNFNNRHFNLLHKLTDKYNEIKKLPEYSKIKRMNMGRISKAQPALAKHYGYTSEAWDKTCGLIEDKIQNEAFEVVYTDVCQPAQ